jgi:hypothetical protein
MAKNLMLASTIALDGVLMYSGTAQDTGVDPFYPTDYSSGSSSSIEVVDSCLGRTDYSGTYYYRTASPCLQVSYIPIVGAECTQCKLNMKQYFNEQIRSFSLPVVGLTKSGHVVYGPYWPGNGSKVGGNVLDSCNGWFMPNPDTASSTKWLYGYVATEYHPYGPACFGPANWPERE